jgi:hypothetical protein
MGTQGIAVMQVVLDADADENCTMRPAASRTASSSAARHSKTCTSTIAPCIHRWVLQGRTCITLSSRSKLQLPVAAHFPMTCCDTPNKVVRAFQAWYQRR